MNISKPLTHVWNTIKSDYQQAPVHIKVSAGLLVAGCAMVAGAAIEKHLLQLPATPGTSAQIKHVQPK